MAHTLFASWRISSASWLDRRTRWLRCSTSWATRIARGAAAGVCPWQAGAPYCQSTLPAVARIGTTPDTRAHWCSQSYMRLGALWRAGWISGPPPAVGSAVGVRRSGLVHSCPQSADSAPPPWCQSGVVGSALERGQLACAGDRDLCAWSVPADVGGRQGDAGVVHHVHAGGTDEASAVAWRKGEASNGASGRGVHGCGLREQRSRRLARAGHVYCGVGCS